MTQPAILLCGHGSRDVHAIEEFERLAEHIAARLPERRVTHGFLEFALPTIGTQLDMLRDEGVREIEAVPGMLFAAGHAKNDIPSVLNNYTAQNQQITIGYGRELAIDPLLLRAAEERIASVLGTDVERKDTLLMVVGRGTSDSDANSNIAKISRMLWEGMGFGWAEVSYSGVTEPRVQAALERVVRLGFRRIVVFPYFLFTGILVKRIYDAADIVQTAHPEIEILKAPYLNDHPLVLDAVLARIGEISQGTNVMNCLLCKYREQIIGFEGDHGAAQVGHHHHVEGIGTDADHHHHSHDD